MTVTTNEPTKYAFSAFRDRNHPTRNKIRVSVQGLPGTFHTDSSDDLEASVIRWIAAMTGKPSAEIQVENCNGCG